MYHIRRVRVTLRQSVKCLFLSLPAHGHTNPTLPLVRELVARGEQVAYCSTAEFAGRVELAGARYLPYRNRFLEDLSVLPERLEELAWLLMRTTGEVLDTQLDSFRAEKPDYIVADSVAPWGHWVGEALGVPVITSVCTFAVNRHVLAYGVKQGARPKSARVLWSKVRHLQRAWSLQREIGRRHGLRGPGMQRLLSGNSGLNIVYTSRRFQPCADSFDGRYRFVGPSIGPRPDAPLFPWPSLRHPVVVYVSMGTLFNRDAAFHRACFDALGGLDCQVILSTGATQTPQSPPPNFVVVPQAPQLEVLQRARVFVSHGGMNSVSESLYYGVPVLVVPQMSEQHIVGRRAQELGAGLCLPPSEATAQRIRIAVERLLAEDEFCENANVLRHSFLAAGGAQSAAAAILSHLERSELL